MFPKNEQIEAFVLPKEIQTLVMGKTLKIDSRQIKTGDVFIACQGEYTDGRNYIEAALKEGAAFVFWDDDGQFQWQKNWTTPNLGVNNLSKRAGLVAAACYQYPGNQLNIWGVTGTNGKTSISQWLAQAADLLDQKCAIMGTVGNGFWQHLKTSSHTTLDSVSVQTWLKTFVAEKAKIVAMEVSSHGLDQNRVVGVPFRTAVFTNLTRDHLDYHKDMAHYGACKEKLFHWQGLKEAIINVDDSFGQGLLARIQSQDPDVVTYGYGFSEQASIRINQFHASSKGMHVHFDTPWGEGVVYTHLLGRFNAQNLAACLGVLCSNGFKFADVLTVLAQLRPATGRMDCIIGQHQPLIVVDYAHTPDALEKALTTLQEIKITSARLWCVFGCGGNRDRGKRPLMGAVATENADCVVVTSDNPRMEEPDEIIQDILPAVPNPELIESDRSLAIQYAVTHADIDDIVLIAGKGHETYQDSNGEKHHFSDFEEAKKALQQR